MTYAFLYVFSFLCTKGLGLERTTSVFRKIGLFLKRFFSFHQETDLIEKKLARGLEKVPVAAKCLDQAVVAWYVLNLHGHPASLKIGISLTPLESHAWVVSEGKVFVDTYNIPDLKVVAEYGPWKATSKVDL